MAVEAVTTNAPFRRSRRAGGKTQLHAPPSKAGSSRDIAGDRPPLPLPWALMALGRCALRTVVLLSRHEISQPAGHVGQVLDFSDSSHGRVYRETVVKHAPTDEPVVLVVAFR